MIAGMKTGAYVFLNFDNTVCRTFSKPVRNDNGACVGLPVAQPRPGARWQIQQAWRLWVPNSHTLLSSRSMLSRPSHLVDGIQNILRSATRLSACVPGWIGGKKSFDVCRESSMM